MISSIVLLVLVAFNAILSGQAFGQSLHNRTIYEAAKRVPDSKRSQIEVGLVPTAVGIVNNMVYVVNTLYNSVSLMPIDGE